MDKVSKVARLPDKEWWGITPKKNYSYTIEWTPKYGGYVRCKVNTSTVWKFKPCEFVRFALPLGNILLVGEELAKLPDEDWWDMTGKQNYSYAIEWIPNYGGWVRARMLASNVWLFAKCTSVMFAVSIGNNILVNHV